MPHFSQSKMVKEWSHGVGTPILVNEGEVFDLWPKRWLFGNEFHVKLLKALNLVISKVKQGVHFQITVSWPKSNTSASIDQKWGF